MKLADKTDIAVPALTPDAMLARFLASDAAYKGRFLTGVRTTGIYCLPSCAARKPKPENVAFFDTENAAREAGLRPCKRRRPDHFYKSFDPDADRLDNLVNELRATPQNFPDVSALATRAEVGATKLHALFRRAYHQTPGGFLARARIARAQELLTSGESVTDTALAVGYESLSAFHDAFRAVTCMTPGEWRRVGKTTGDCPPGFALALPPNFRADLALVAFARDPHSVCDRVTGREIAKAMTLNHENESIAAVLRLDLGDHRRAVCRIETAHALPPQAVRDAHTVALRLLGLHDDPAAFEARCDRDPILRPSVENRRGLRISLSATLFEALSWAIIGQQISLPFAYMLRRRLAELCGAPVPGSDLIASPTADAVARLDYADLTTLQFSRRKAEYLIDAARLVASGDLPLNELMRAATAPQIEARLLAMRGFGPWSANYVMMRGFGFADCAPLGDTGLTAGLQRFWALHYRPDATQTIALMEPFAPHRSLATAHLWASLQESTTP